MLMPLTRLILSTPARYVTKATKVRFAPTGLNSAYIIRHSPSPLNKKVESDELIKRDEDDYEVEVQEPKAIEPIPQRLIKRVSVEYHGIAAAHFNDDTMWHPIYRVPYIKTLSFVIRMKVWLTAATVFSSITYTVPILMGNWNASLMPAVTVSLISLAGLAYIGDYFRRLVVQIYATEDVQYVRFCRFSFFGNRKDMVLPRDCVVRLPEVNRSFRLPVMQIKFRMPEGNKISLDYDNYEFYDLGFRLPIGLGGVLDRDKFQEALGYMLSYRVGG